MIKRRSTSLFLAASLLVWLFLFGRFLIGQTCFGYRDTAHLYYPLFEWIQNQWSQGEIPLWNPLDDFGQPLVADGVSSVFYPLKAVFFLTVLPYAARFAFYVSIHAVIAAWGTYFLARSLRLSPAASALSASGFALSGAVLFQTSNVVYLVGAAWLPWALASGWAALRTAKPRELVACAVFIALMILGGDPQSAYHVLLILGASAMIAMLRARLTLRGPTRFASVARFGVIAILAAGLSAIQWLPSWQWHQRSTRANPNTARSIWESASDWAAGHETNSIGWFHNPISGTHHEHVYQFSQPPWSAAELIWPNVSGKEFPTNRRWTAAIPAADRVWTPSLYFGLAVVILAFCGARLGRGPRVIIALTWLTIIFGLGSLGWYGAGWIARESKPLFGGVNFDDLPPPILGIYWWMVTLLPGYVSFRYPAKLFVVATLGASLLAGHQLTRLNLGRSKSVRVSAAGILVASALLLGVTFIPEFRGLWVAMPSDSTFGPFDLTGSLVDLRITFAHASIVSGLLWLILRSHRNASISKSSAVRRIVALTVADLVIANAWLIVGVPAESFTTQIAESVATKLSTEKRFSRARRFYLDEIQPESWRITKSAQRLEEVIRFERASLFPKFHLSRNVGLIGSFHALEPLDLAWFNELVGVAYDPILAIENRIMFFNPPLEKVSGTLEGLEKESTTKLPESSRHLFQDSQNLVVESLPASPRISFLAEWTRPNFSRTNRLRGDQRHDFIVAIRRDLTQLAQADARFRTSFNRPAGSQRPEAVRLNGEPIAPLSFKRPAADRSAAPENFPTAQILDESASQVHVHVRCQTAGWLILKDYWDAGWRVDIHDVQTGTQVVTQPERFSGIFRAVNLPHGGEFDVRFIYRPQSFVWGATSSLGTMLFIFIATVIRWFHLRRQLPAR